MNNEIEVGDYVRTKNGQIDIFEGTDENYMFARCKNRTYWKLDIVKHSKNKIDLVECSDYVNGNKVLEVMEDMNTGEIHLEMTSNYTNQEIGDCTIYDKDIKTIVTKESFKEREYVF